jgi:hypothetical protein
MFTECDCLCTFICKASARVLYVYVIIACSLKRKLMWHSSVEYWVCYNMFRSKRTKVFSRVTWPLKARNVTSTVSELTKASEEWHA